MNKHAAAITRAIHVGVGLQDQEAHVSELQSEDIPSELNVSQILPRAQASTRELCLKHLTSLAESISFLGLIEPIVVDKEYRLVAGLHRLAASRLLAEPVGKRMTTWMSLWAECERPSVMPNKLESLPQRTGIVPVNVLLFKSSEDPEQALLIEIAENDKRRNYTRTEVQSFARRLQKAGYRYSSGRPKEGEQALIPVLAATLGMSSRTVRRFMSLEESGTRVLVSPATLAARVRKALEAWIASGVTPKQKELGRRILRELG